MIELRWVVRNESITITDSCVVEDVGRVVEVPRRVLQYRSYAEPYALNPHWGEWQDVPTVTETTEAGR